MNKGTRSIPSGSKGGTVKSSTPAGKGKGSSQFGGRKPSGGRV